MKKRIYFARNSNLGPQDGRCGINHRAMAATSMAYKTYQSRLKMWPKLCFDFKSWHRWRPILICFWHVFEWSDDNFLTKIFEEKTFRKYFAWKQARERRSADICFWDKEGNKLTLLVTYKIFFSTIIMD